MWIYENAYLSRINVNEMGSHWAIFLLYIDVVLSWPEDGRSRPKHVAKYNLIVIIASCSMCVVYWRCIMYYTDLIYTTGWRLSNSELWFTLDLNLNFKNVIILLCNYFTIWVMISRRMRWAGHLARVGGRRAAYRISVRKPEGKRQIVIPVPKWDDNIKMDLWWVGRGWR